MPPYMRLLELKKIYLQRKWLAFFGSVQWLKFVKVVSTEQLGALKRQIGSNKCEKC